ncbi:hypothetical protein NDU88_005118 [Pleurodeles waltl]|uniref:Uncharacterized protein n=1 Tax=Pleurodeles waltl TaxID=8319 RepID=A0AAV7MA31_PLEWA|nr:hypothetical protein NDU88_005118 [Pleurodeles waltl]
MFTDRAGTRGHFGEHCLHSSCSWRRLPSAQKQRRSAGRGRKTRKESEGGVTDYGGMRKQRSGTSTGRSCGIRTERRESGGPGVRTISEETETAHRRSRHRGNKRLMKKPKGRGSLDRNATASS